MLSGTGFSEAVLEERSVSLRRHIIPEPKVHKWNTLKNFTMIQVLIGLLHISEVGLEWILLALHSLLMDLTTSFGSVVRNLY